MSGKNEFIKFLLLGITGDLSQRKILPALAQFSEKNKQVGLDLIGYSRKKPDLRKINLLLDKHSKEIFNSLESIEHIQGNYENNQIFGEIIPNLNSNERLITYLAVPPEVFVKFIINSCPFNKQKFDIIVEKPFGSNEAEAERILTILQACDLSKQIKFFDHYLFKNCVIYGQEELPKLKLENKKIKKIQVKALEKLGVENRVGYYEQTGALKDMLPHLYSLLKINLKILNKKIDLNKVEVKNLELKQYKDYLKDTNLKESNTNTYFKTTLEAFTENADKFELSLESGKRLKEKLTEIKVLFDDGSEIIWNIEPNHSIKIKDKEEFIELNNCEKENYDHTNLFEALYKNETGNFVTPEEIKNSWKLHKKITDFKKDNKTSLNLY